MENTVVCNCKKVTYNDIVVALHAQTRFDDVLKSFEAVQNVTNCSTGCGGCYDKVLKIISDVMAG